MKFGFPVTSATIKIPLKDEKTTVGITKVPVVWDNRKGDSQQEKWELLWVCCLDWRKCVQKLESVMTTCTGDRILHFVDCGQPNRKGPEGAGMNRMPITDLALCISRRDSNYCKTDFSPPRPIHTDWQWSSRISGSWRCPALNLDLLCTNIMHLLNPWATAVPPLFIQIWDGRGLNSILVTI